MTATEPAVAVPRPAKVAGTNASAGSEARTAAQALLRATRTRVPVDLLTEHLARLHGDAGFPVLRAAAEATARRLRIAAEEGLRVRQRPEASPFGAYTTARKRASGRPYTTVLHGLAPLDGSCDCPDFRGNSLALCKHLLAVLADLARTPRAFAQAAARAPRASRAPALRWWPVKPLLGDGDWLQQVRLIGPTHGPLPGPWVRLRSALRSPPTAPPQRLALLELLATAADARHDPALAALIADERQRLQQATELAPLGRALSRHLRGFRRTLYPYQRDGVARFLDTGRLLLADDMGLGKTTQAIAACHVLWRQRLVARGLLLVPAALKSQWLREWQACCDLPIAIVDGSPEERARLWRDRKRGFLLANYEQLLRDLELVAAFGPDLVLLDEAQRIKNWATRTAATVKQLQPRFRLVLTGTPFENRLLELDSLLEWLDRRPLQPQWRVEPFHRIPGDDDSPGGGWRHLDVLRKRLAPVLLRRRRQEVLGQLPGRTDTRIDVPLTPPQREEHDARIQPIAVLLKIAERRPLTQSEFLRLMTLFTEQRIASNGIAQFAFDELWPGIQKAHPEPALLDSLSMPKLLELRQLVQQLAVGQERKLVVFSQWRRALRLSAWACSDLFAGAGISSAFFTGGEGSRKRDDSLVAFHDDARVRVLFATDAGGVGLNLQKAASCVVHFDLPWNPAVFEQRVGRVWRLGQTDKVDVYSLVSEDCIESRMADVLRHKQATFAALFDGTSEEVRFEQQGGFLATARQIAGDGAPWAGRRATSVAPPPREGDELDAAPVAAAHAPTDDSLDTAPATPAMPIDKHTMRAVLDGLQIRPLRDGGLVIEAPKESAAALAGLLRGLLAVVEGAARE